jgi:hypothetical protein
MAFYTHGHTLEIQVVYFSWSINTSRQNTFLLESLTWINSNTLLLEALTWVNNNIYFFETLTRVEQFIKQQIQIFFFISSYWPPPKSLHFWIFKFAFWWNFASKQNVDSYHSSQVARIIYGKGKVYLFIKIVLWNSRFKIVSVWTIFVHELLFNFLCS